MNYDHWLAHGNPGPRQAPCPDCNGIGITQCQGCSSCDQELNAKKNYPMEECDLERPEHPIECSRCDGSGKVDRSEGEPD